MFRKKKVRYIRDVSTKESPHVGLWPIKHLETSIYGGFYKGKHVSIDGIKWEDVCTPPVTVSLCKGFYTRTAYSRRQAFSPRQRPSTRHGSFNPYLSDITCIYVRLQLQPAYLVRRLQKVYPLALRKHKMSENIVIGVELLNVAVLSASVIRRWHVNGSRRRLQLPCRLQHALVYMCPKNDFICHRVMGWRCDPGFVSQLIRSLGRLDK